MSLFFEKKTQKLTAEEHADYEREAGLRVLNYLNGISKKAVSILPPKGRDWFKVDLSESPAWFDPEYPHLIVDELHRRFGRMPDASPEWIDFNEEQTEAVAVLLAIQRAVQSLRGVDQQHALRILGAGISLGYNVTKAHVMPWESSARRDIVRQEGTKKPRRPEISQWIQEAIERKADVTRAALWQEAPQWITDQIGKDAFLKRVSKVRKK